MLSQDNFDDSKERDNEVVLRELLSDNLITRSNYSLLYKEDLENNVNEQQMTAAADAMVVCIAMGVAVGSPALISRRNELLCRAMGYGWLSG